MESAFPLRAPELLTEAERDPEQAGGGRCRDDGAARSQREVQSDHCSRRCSVSSEQGAESREQSGVSRVESDEPGGVNGGECYRRLEQIVVS